MSSPHASDGVERAIADAEARLRAAVHAAFDPDTDLAAVKAAAAHRDVDQAVAAADDQLLEVVRAAHDAVPGWPRSRPPHNPAGPPRLTRAARRRRPGRARSRPERGWTWSSSPTCRPRPASRVSSWACAARGSQWCWTPIATPA
jgi:hypothetical protein